MLFLNQAQKTKSRLGRDLLFAVGIGYADITKKRRALCPEYFYKNTRPMSLCRTSIIITQTSSKLQDKYNRFYLPNSLFCTTQPLFFTFRKIPHLGY